MHRVLIVGFGEVGKPMFEVVRGVYPDVEWLDIENKVITGDHDIMHITYPELAPEKFVALSVEYVKRFSPKLVLIESTVSPGTTNTIYDKLNRTVLLCHSPVRGNMTDGMKQGLLQYTKFIGPTSPEAGKMAKEYYETLGLKTLLCSSPTATELGKILETTYRGIMMSWFQEINRMCRKFDANESQVVEFLRSTERDGKQARPIFHPGVIGGHCIIPNAQKLQASYPSKFVEALLESNKRRQQEISEQEPTA